MRNFEFVPLEALLIMISVIGLVGCTTSGRAPVNLLQMAEVVEWLEGTQGKTLDDQRRIDRVMARSCAAGLKGKVQCDLQTKASAERKSQ